MQFLKLLRLHRRTKSETSISIVPCEEGKMEVIDNMNIEPLHWSSVLAASYTEPVSLAEAEDVSHIVTIPIVTGSILSTSTSFHDRLLTKMQPLFKVFDIKGQDIVPSNPKDGLFDSELNGKKVERLSREEKLQRELDICNRVLNKIDGLGINTLDILTAQPGLNTAGQAVAQSNIVEEGSRTGILTQTQLVFLIRSIPTSPAAPILSSFPACFDMNDFIPSYYPQSLHDHHLDLLRSLWAEERKSKQERTWWKRRAIDMGKGALTPSQTFLELKFSSNGEIGGEGMSGEEGKFDRQLEGAFGEKFNTMMENLHERLGPLSPHAPRALSDNRKRAEGMVKLIIEEQRREAEMDVFMSLFKVKCGDTGERHGIVKEVSPGLGSRKSAVEMVVASNGLPELQAKSLITIPDEDHPSAVDDLLNVLINRAHPLGHRGHFELIKDIQNKSWEKLEKLVPGSDIRTAESLMAMEKDISWTQTTEANQSADCGSASSHSLTHNFFPMPCSLVVTPPPAKSHTQSLSVDSDTPPLAASPSIQYSPSLQEIGKAISTGALRYHGESVHPMTENSCDVGQSLSSQADEEPIGAVDSFLHLLTTAKTRPLDKNGPRYSIQLRKQKDEKEKGMGPVEETHQGLEGKKEVGVQSNPPLTHGMVETSSSLHVSPLDALAQSIVSKDVINDSFTSRTPSKPSKPTSPPSPPASGTPIKPHVRSRRLAIRQTSLKSKPALGSVDLNIGKRCPSVHTESVEGHPGGTSNKYEGKTALPARATPSRIPSIKGRRTGGLLDTIHTPSAAGVTAAHPHGPLSTIVDLESSYSHANTHTPTFSLTQSTPSTDRAIRSSFTLAPKPKPSSLQIPSHPQRKGPPSAASAESRLSGPNSAESSSLSSSKKSKKLSFKALTKTISSFMSKPKSKSSLKETTPSSSINPSAKGKENQDPAAVARVKVENLGVSSCERSSGGGIKNRLTRLPTLRRGRS